MSGIHEAAAAVQMKPTLSKHLVEVNCDAPYEVVRAIVFIIALQKCHKRTCECA